MLLGALSGFACECHSPISTLNPILLKKTNDSTWLLQSKTLLQTFSKHSCHNWYISFLQDSVSCRRAVTELAERYRYFKIDAIACRNPEEILLGSALAYELHVPFLFLTTASCEASSDLCIVFLEGVLSEGSALTNLFDSIEAQGGHIVETACLLEFKSKKEGNEPTPPIFSLLSLEENLR